MEKEIVLRFRLDDEDCQNLRKMIAFDRAYSVLKGYDCDWDDSQLEPFLSYCLRSEVKKALVVGMERSRLLLESCQRGEERSSLDALDALPDSYSLLAALLACEATTEEREIAAYDKASLDAGEVLDGVSVAYPDSFALCVLTRAAFV